MKIELIQVTNTALLKEFIFLPSKLHAGYENFVPPFYKDEWEFHDPIKNKHLAWSDHIKLLAFQNNRCVGRIMGIIYHPWNRKHNQKSARFYQFDCIPDNLISDALLGYIENWAREKGMNEIIGSFGFSDKDPQGIQVEGYEFPPVIASVSHEPYLADLVTASGYSKFKDCVSYKMEIPEKLPDFYINIYNRILKNQQLKLISFTKRSDLKPYFIPVMQLMNEAYKNIFGFVAMEDEDIKHLADQYLSVLDPKLVKIVTDPNNKPVAFVIAMANISKGIRKAKGKLFPFGFMYLLMEMKRSTQLDLLLGAVADKYRGRGLNVLLGISLMETARGMGMKIMDSHLILEENRLMRAELEKIGGVLYKRYRIFIKKL
ncbi:MAG TPA: hypothetical protein PKD91_02060 [Bacteroidia bacterium]|nr:hypothetical protein [Bacteroidia bacterium]